MRIGIPRELKPLEGRVGLIPAACGELVRQGHEVFIESSAGVKSGYTDDQYRELGVTVLDTADALFEKAEMIIKVKEPIEPDLKRLRKDHLLFCYLHLAAEPELTARLKKIGLTAVAFETVEEGGNLPLLAPMSDIAGRISIQVATHLLHQPEGGKGILLGGVPAAKRGKVVIIGCGMAGGNAAQMAAGLGAEVVVFDKDPAKLAWARTFGSNVTALYPHTDDVIDQLKTADIAVGAVLVAGARAPHVISKEAVRRMQPGSVVVDISVDQGGCVESTRPTTYDDPTYEWEGVTHFTVTNMPGAVPRTASQALSAAIAPYCVRLANGQWRDYEPLIKGINVENGKVVHPAIEG
ncbi:alanine dehydrogenase [Natronospira proteinivora]|uniref:alanine dehydrogenase n=1 Tax=Natronospira proteinivora TaxID=1807133 RepID=A0ABT1G607_9GAMM|nr:alanine dehydrogenase [Natronospira proteinivora]MCP1726733.1 alanine dehydrogenase [Natronospira proteinivora]